MEKGSPDSKALADDIRRLYFNGGKVTRNGYWNVSMQPQWPPPRPVLGPLGSHPKPAFVHRQLYTDLLFGTGIVDAARLHAAHPAGAPVFFYLFCVVGKNNALSGFLRPENPTGATPRLSATKFA